MLHGAVGQRRAFAQLLLNLRYTRRCLTRVGALFGIGMVHSAGSRGCTPRPAVRVRLCGVDGRASGVYLKTDLRTSLKRYFFSEISVSYGCRKSHTDHTGHRTRPGSHRIHFAVPSQYFTLTWLVHDTLLVSVYISHVFDTLQYSCVYTHHYILLRVYIHYTPLKHAQILFELQNLVNSDQPC